MNTYILLKKIYYKYINKSDINHYRLLLTTEEYIDIGKNYFNKYPSAMNWINMNNALFSENPKAKLEYLECSKKQKQLEQVFFNNVNYICKNCAESEKLNICSDKFQKYYVNCSYHYGQTPHNVISIIMKDIEFLENKTSKKN